MPPSSSTPTQPTLSKLPSSTESVSAGSLGEELLEKLSVINTPTEEEKSWAGLKVFISTFMTIFLAELGDKTQLTTLLMAAESESPWLVFLGAGVALVTTSFLGVWVGHWLAKHITPRLLELSAGVVLLVIATTLLWDVWLS
jgi:Ca2+/H+ antiporter, TMEM165/GDT1 family